jgi:AcrR family transcriptional regulator
VSPRTADPAIGTALVEAAARLIASEGSSALTLRRLAREVGTSTMAVYTHFGSMEEVRRQVRREGFARLAAHLADVEDTRDPVFDLVLLGWAYYANAAANPHLYRVMFMEQPIDAEDAAVGLGTFDRLVRGVQRCIDAGRFLSADAADLATQLWAFNHGLVTLQLVALLSPDRSLEALVAGSLQLFVAYGDDRSAASRSLTHARRHLQLE